MRLSATTCSISAVPGPVCQGMSANFSSPIALTVSVTPIFASSLAGGAAEGGPSVSTGVGEKQRCDGAGGDGARGAWGAQRTRRNASSWSAPREYVKRDREYAKRDLGYAKRSL
jgi:hypothetical protein